LNGPFGTGSQFAVSAGRSFWIRIVSEPSGFLFSPSVVLPKLWRPRSFSTNSMSEPYIAMLHQQELAGVEVEDVFPRAGERFALVVDAGGINH
jgi:hypothetical protein